MDKKEKWLNFTIGGNAGQTPEPKASETPTDELAPRAINPDGTPTKLGRFLAGLDEKPAQVEQARSLPVASPGAGEEASLKKRRPYRPPSVIGLQEKGKLIGERVASILENAPKMSFTQAAQEIADRAFAEQRRRAVLIEGPDAADMAKPAKKPKSRRERTTKKGSAKAVDGWENIMPVKKGWKTIAIESQEELEGLKRKVRELLDRHWDIRECATELRDLVKE